MEEAAVTPEAIAEWMFSQIALNKPLYQHDAVTYIAKAYGEEFTYTNENGNPAIDKRVLRAFKKVTGDSVVWDRWGFCWRLREPGDATSRKQQ